MSYGGSSITSISRQGADNATIRVKVRNLRSGSTVERTYPSGSRVQDVRLDHPTVQYLYHDGDLYFFMNTETYEQPAIAGKVLGNAVNFLTDGMQLGSRNGRGAHQHQATDHSGPRR